MLDRNNTIVADLAPAGATTTLDSHPRRIADFATLGEALDYAGRGRRGMNFHDARGTLVRAYPFSELREDALAHAQRFIALGMKPGDRLALIAVVAFVLVVELLNTAIEKLADRVNLAIDPQIGRVKDMGSAAVGLALLIAAIAWLLALAERLGLI